MSCVDPGTGFTFRSMVDYTYIESDSALREAAARLRDEPLLAVDTEAAGYHRYTDRVSLVQLSTREENWLIDPHAVDDFSPVAEALQRADVETVLHDADFDFRILDRDLGIRIRGLFDTQVAAAFLGEKSLGLGAQLERWLDVRIPKKFQRADWAARPIPEDMREYAVMDTAYLPALRDHLRDALERSDRLDWAREEFLEREKIRWEEPDEPETAYLRTKGARDLPPRGLAVLRELHGWRETEAERRDAAPFRVLRNEVLLDLAVRAPRSPDALQSIKGVSSRLVRESGDDLLAAIERGLRIPEGELPEFPRRPYVPPDPVVQEAVERMRRARTDIARELELDPGFLFSRALLSEVARHRPGTPEEMRSVPGVRRWQVDAAGDALLTALHATS